MIKVYSKPSCVQCNATYIALRKANIAYEVIDVSQDAEALEFIMGLGHQQAPVVYVDEFTHWSGFRPDLIQKLKEQNDD